jgi:hypothetical protein
VTTPEAVVVVGAGAAGLMAALVAARAGAAVVVLERTAHGGRKILMSGGGRCNVLPSTLAPERFVTGSTPHLMRGLLRSWPLAGQRAFFEHDLGIPLALETETGKLFPASNRARDVRDALVAAGRRAGVSFRFSCSLTGLEPSTHGWTLGTTAGEVAARRVVLATGGLSIPATGSDGAGLRMAAGLGHRVHTPYPALTPLLADPPVHAALSGVSLAARVSARSERGSAESSGGFLFTHRGYSGPAVLDVSHVAVCQPAARIRVRWGDTSASEWDAALTSARAQVSTVLAARLPQRLVQQLMIEAGVPLDRLTSQLRRAERLALIERLTAYTLPWTGDEGFKKAEVTGGGIALEDVDRRTLESRRHRGLFLCGEMLDAFGPIGGHNFAWAWATGRLAGRAAAVSGDGAPNPTGSGRV